MRNILDICESSEPIEYARGDTILHEGKKAGVLFVLIEGKVDIVKGGHLLNTVSEPGSIYGEISMLLNVPHMASVKVVESSRFYKISNTDPMFNSSDLSMQLALVLASRLHKITKYLVDMKDRSVESEEQFEMVCEALEKYLYQDK